MKVAWIRLNQGDEASADLVRTHHRICLDHLMAGRVRLVLVGGAPGTGKSTVARGLAEQLGAVIISSDDVRDELIPRSAGTGDQLHAGRYAPELVDAVYAEVLRRAERHLAAGRSVVADASWLRARRRSVARDVAGSGHAELIEVRCECPPAVAAGRIETRRGGGTVSSEATPAIGVGLAAEEDSWPEAIRLDTAGTAEETAAALLALLRDQRSYRFTAEPASSDQALRDA